MKYVAVIQHTQSEWLGHIEDHLEGRGIRFGYHRPFTTGGKLPVIDTIGDGLMLVGGGAWGSAPGAHQLPTLEEEVRLARACLMLGKPVIGIGLGSQILSLAAEGGIEPAPFVFEVATATRARSDALGGLLPESFPFATYMRDRPRPPDYAEILATDPAGRPSVFQIGPNAFGFAGHPGLRAAMIEDLIMEFEEAPPDCTEGLDRLRKVAVGIEDALVPVMTGLVAACKWMS